MYYYNLVQKNIKTSNNELAVDCYVQDEQNSVCPITQLKSTLVNLTVVIFVRAERVYLLQEVQSKHRSVKELVSGANNV